MSDGAAARNKKPQDRALTSSQSQAQRERKREIDRKSQRAVRERTKAYIAQLERENETLVELSQHTDNAHLSTKVREQSEENERLRVSLQKIESLVRDCLAGEAAKHGGLKGSGRDRDHEDPMEGSSRSHYHQQQQQQQQQQQRRPEQGHSQPQWQMPNPTESPSQTETRTPDSNPSSTAAMLACGDGIRNFYAIVNQAIMFMEAASQGLPCPDVDEDEDIILTAIFHGWSEASAKHHLDAGWQLLRLMDEGIWHHSTPVQRAASMRVMRAMSLISSRIDVPPRQRPPSFMEPTELQRTVEHDRLVDYFPWPPLRDWLIFTGLKTVPEFMTTQFAKDISFTWPYELRDIAKQNAITGAYTFSREFDDAFHKLESWQSKVLELFSARRDVVDLSNPFAQWLSPGAMTATVAMQQQQQQQQQQAQQQMQESLNIAQSGGSEITLPSPGVVAFADLVDLGLIDPPC